MKKYLAIILTFFVLSIIGEASVFALPGPGGTNPDAINDPPTLEETARADCNAAYRPGAGAGSDERRERVQACVDAYIATKNTPNETVNEICKNLSGNKLVGCKEGYDQADGRGTPDPKPTKSNAAYDFCHDKYPNQGGGTGAAAGHAEKINACIDGYKKGFDQGGRVSDICAGKSGDVLQACRVGANAGKRHKERGTVKQDGADDANAAGDDGGDCNGQGLSAGWIICGVVEIVSAFSDFAFNKIIQPIMEQSPLSTNTSDPTYRSWQGFRFIANILLVISMLAIVYTQAKGGE